MTFMKCHHGSVDMRHNHGKVVTGRDVSFWDIIVHEVTFSIPQEYVKGHSIYQQYVEEPHNRQDAVQEK